MNSRKIWALAGAAGLAVSTAANAQYGMVNNVAGTFTDISSTGTPILTAVNDDGTAAFTSSVTNALVTSANLTASVNGWINDGSADDSYSNQSLPVAGGGSFLLCPLWDDLYLNNVSPSGKVVHKASNEGGVNVEIIEWVNCRRYDANTGAFGNFEVKIFAAGGPAFVQYLYQDPAWALNGSSATIGVQWSSGSSSLFSSTYGFNQSVLTAPNMVLSAVTVPSGACCLPTSGCAIVDGASCASAGGTYGGNNSTCASLNCPTGACCLPNFTCATSSPTGCTNQSGIYRGDNSVCATANCPGPTAGPDVIVGEVYDISYDGAVGNISAYSVGTDSCNLGDVGVTWVQNTNQHPVISGNMFRLKTVSGAPHFEQLGLSWFKNGFLATNGSFCGACSTPAGDHLGPHGCSDVYTSGLNGDQANMGPRSAANGTTGDFPYPYTLGWQTTGNAIFKRCQVATSDIDPTQNAGALYFADAHYLVPDDARFSNNGANATNGLNNYSYRQIVFANTTTAPSFNGLTHEQMPGIQAWRDHDVNATLVNAEYIDSTLGTSNIVARFIVGGEATSLGNGQWHYEYNVYNVNADRSGGSFSVPIPAGAQITNVGFHAPLYHSGEIYDNTVWNSSVTGSAVTWTPAVFNPAANENAIRWGTMYTFRFDANVGPATGAITLGLFKAGSPSSLQPTGLPVPGASCYANCDNSTSAPILNVADFTCFLQRFAASDSYANCDASTTPPVLNVADFTCFLQKYATGCP